MSPLGLSTTTIGVPQGDVSTWTARHSFTRRSSSTSTFGRRAKGTGRGFLYLGVAPSFRIREAVKFLSWPKSLPNSSLFLFSILCRESWDTLWQDFQFTLNFSIQSRPMRGSEPFLTM